MPIDLTTIMTGYGPLPAVAAVEDQTGDWSEVGESRIIRLADGHGMLETITRVDRPHSFHYTITELTNVLRFLVRRFHGSWQFSDAPPLAPDLGGITGAETETAAADDGPPTEAGPSVAARWRYEFEPRSALTRPIAWLILRRFWRPLMEDALGRAAAQAVARANP